MQVIAKHMIVKVSQINAEICVFLLRFTFSIGRVNLRKLHGFGFERM
jgi:hypothetical protein